MLADPRRILSAWSMPPTHHYCWAHGAWGWQGDWRHHCCHPGTRCWPGVCRFVLLLLLVGKETKGRTQSNVGGDAAPPALLRLLGDAGASAFDTQCSLQPSQARKTATATAIANHYPIPMEARLPTPPGGTRHRRRRRTPGARSQSWSRSRTRSWCRGRARLCRRPRATRKDSAPPAIHIPERRVRRQSGGLR